VPDTLEQQVEESIQSVLDERAMAIDDLESGWTSDADEQAISSIRSLPIAAWQLRGEEAIKRKDQKPPGRGGWKGWINAGNVWLKGIRDINDLGNQTTLKNLTDTADDVARDVRRIGRQAATLAKQAAREAGNAAGSLLTPLALPLGIILALGLIGFTIFRKGVPSG